MERIERSADLQCWIKKQSSIMQKDTQNKIVKKYQPFAIMLFGSYASRSPHEYSDIDIAIVYNGFSGDWLDASKDFWKTTESISKWIEPILLDITSGKSGFVEHVLKTGEYIYRAA